MSDTERDIVAMPFMHCPWEHLSSVNTIDEINAWCTDKLSSRWRMSSFYPGYGATPPTWYFEAREDHLAFVMRWG